MISADKLRVMAYKCTCGYESASSASKLASSIKCPQCEGVAVALVTDKLAVIKGGPFYPDVAAGPAPPKLADPSEFDKFAVGSADVAAVVECRRVKRAGGFWWQFTIKYGDGISETEVRAGLRTWLK